MIILSSPCTNELTAMWKLIPFEWSKVGLLFIFKCRFNVSWWRHMVEENIHPRCPLPCSFLCLSLVFTSVYMNESHVDNLFLSLCAFTITWPVVPTLPFIRVWFTLIQKNRQHVTLQLNAPSGATLRPSVVWSLTTPGSRCHWLLSMGGGKPATFDAGPKPG